MREWRTGHFRTFLGGLGDAGHSLRNHFLLYHNQIVRPMLRSSPTAHGEPMRRPGISCIGYVRLECRIGLMLGRCLLTLLLACWLEQVDGRKGAQKCHSTKVKSIAV